MHSRKSKPNEQYWTGNIRLQNVKRKTNKALQNKPKKVLNEIKTDIDRLNEPLKRS